MLTFAAVGQDERERRYAHLNLPHARTIVDRIGRSLEAVRAFTEEGNGGSSSLRDAYAELQRAVRPYDEDPPMDEALVAADGLAELGRALVGRIAATPHVRGDRLGQNVRNLFEVLGLPEEGARLSLLCGEREDSPLR